MVLNDLDGVLLTLLWALPKILLGVLGRHFHKSVSLQQLVLFGKVVESTGSGTLLDQVSPWGKLWGLFFLWFLIGNAIQPDTSHPSTTAAMASSSLELQARINLPSFLNVLRLVLAKWKQQIQKIGINSGATAGTKQTDCNLEALGTGLGKAGERIGSCGLEK